MTNGSGCESYRFARTSSKNFPIRTFRKIVQGLIENFLDQDTETRADARDPSFYLDDYELNGVVAAPPAGCGAHAQ
jgi:hypothetical protein